VSAWPSSCCCALNEQQCRAQVVGGVVQGLGSAVSEKFVFQDGRLLNNSFTDYKIPTAKDIPAEMQQFFVETPHPQGPYGARGVAEHPMISVPSAVGNAIANATGVEFFELPLDPERIYLTLKRAAAHGRTLVRDAAPAHGMAAGSASAARKPHAK
jgi:CO/xanthine dehydrogenase Mo-binding subunit